MDEAGRGCLAGRVYAAAVILKSDQDIERYADSKTLSESRREELFNSIQKHHHFGIGFATPEEIDRMNILAASMLAMRRAIGELGVQTGTVLVDGHLAIRNLEGFRQIPLVKGDQRATPIAAASIMAKVARDRYIVEQSELFPGYGFEKHKGYPTLEHKKSIENLGPTNIHRLTFAGVREFARSSL